MGFIRFSFVLNSLILFLLAGLMLYGPNLLILDGAHSNESLSLLKLDVISIIVLGVISILCFKQVDLPIGFTKMIALSYITFHILSMFHWYGYWQQEFTDTPYFLIIHAVSAMLMVVLYFLNKDESQLGKYN